MTDTIPGKSEKLATTNVRDLVRDVLEARFSPPPYPDDIIDQICLAIEANEEWLERYHGLVKELSHAEGDGWWKVNNWIGRWAKELTGMVVAAASVPAKNTLMKSYSRLKYPTEQDAAIFSKAVETLRGGLSALESTPDLAAIQRGRDEVYARFGPLFSPTHLPTLTADEFVPFLDFKVNRHWSNIHRYKGRLTSDIDLLRQALGILTDEQAPLTQRYDSARQLVDGLGRATATPILHVAYPHKYGVYNTKVEAGLRELGVLPELGPKATEGEQYAAVNDVLLRLADGLEVDLWTLDNLWEWMSRRKKLAPPFDAIFADRAQAEWAFDLFADAVERLGGGADDPRFALTIGKSLLRLNFSQWLLVDFAKSNGYLNLALLIKPTESLFSFGRSTGRARYERSGAFASDPDVAVFQVPYDDARDMSAELRNVYEASMTHIGAHFAHWKGSPFVHAHNAEIFAVLFDDEKREKLLTQGPTTPIKEPRYWRITMPSDLSDDLSNDRGPYNLWAECLRQGVAAIDFDNDFQHPQVKKFAQIAPGDRVVAFLRNRTIGGIGVVTTPYDEQTAREQPADRNYFRGGFWQRVGVDWTAKELDVDKLPKAVQNKFGQSTVIEISESDFAEVEKLMNELPPPPSPPPPPYTFPDFTRHTHLTDARAAELHEMLQDKRQAIFYGPPGTGKTFVARHLGRLITGLADPPPERLTIIQFHPAYGYEEFIEGIRPKGEKSDDGRTVIDYPVKPGAFVRFCRAAAQQGDKPCVFIIDEINRGNIPRIFGELMLLLEYRDQSVPLPYSGDRFRIPPNVYLIGTMNTADRSIALVDFALRRRFHFAHFAADPDLFDRWLKANPPTLPWLGALYRRLTAEAIDDEAYRIGPSVFMRPGITAAQVERAWRYSVMPLLHEYYFDQRPRAELWAWDGDLLRGIRGDYGG